MDAQVCLSCHVLFGGVEFGSLVHVVTAGRTPNAHWKHHANFHGVVLGSLALGQLRRIEIRRKVLVQDLSLSHVDWLCSPVPRGEAVSDLSDDAGFAQAHKVGVKHQHSFHTRRMVLAKNSPTAISVGKLLTVRLDYRLLSGRRPV